VIGEGYGKSITGSKSFYSYMIFGSGILSKSIDLLVLESFKAYNKGDYIVY
jgi:hypothetical protein